MRHALTVLALLFISVAVPRVGSACSCGAWRDVVLPADGTLKVPLNTRIFVARYHHGFLGAGPTLTLQGPSASIATTIEAASTSRAWTRLLTPTEPLTPDTLYTIRAGDEILATFTTGNALDVSAPSAPKAVALTTHFDPDPCLGPNTCGPRASADVAVGAPDEPVLWRLLTTGPGGPTLALFGVDTGALDAGVSMGVAGAYNCWQGFPLPEVSDSHCVTLQVEDLAGNLGPATVAEPECVSLIAPPCAADEDVRSSTAEPAAPEPDAPAPAEPPSSGCQAASQTGDSPAALGLLLLALFGYRRGSTSRVSDDSPYF